MVRVVLTDEEDRVLSLDYWFQESRKIFRNYQPQRCVDFDLDVIPVIRESYLSIKHRGVSFDIVGLLEDKDSRIPLLQLVYSLVLIDRFSSWLREYTLFWEDKCQQSSGGSCSTSADAQAASIKPTVYDLETSSKLDELVNSEKDNIPTRVNSILLILKEILAKMGIYSQISERDMRRVDCPSAELMCLVEAGVSRSRSVSRKNKLRLESVLKSSAPESEEYNPGLASDKTAELQRDLQQSMLCINTQGGDMFRLKFKNLMDLIYWYAHL